MSDIDALITEMRAGLEGLTPVEWSYDDSFYTGNHVFAGKVIVATSVGDCAETDLRGFHIARCSPCNIARLLDEIEALRAENARLKAGPTEDELDAAYHEAYDDGYSDGQRGSDGVMADLWSMLLRHLETHDCTPASDDGYGHNAEQVMDAVFEREANIRADSKRLAEAENARLREVLTFYADGAPCCESDAGDGSLRTTRCASVTCEFPECAKPRFPVWDRGRRAREALKETE